MASALALCTRGGGTPGWGSPVSVGIHPGSLAERGADALHEAAERGDVGQARSATGRA
jgi:hypothetical protein